MSFDWANYSNITPEEYAAKADKFRNKNIFGRIFAEVKDNYHHATAWGNVCDQMAEALEKETQDQMQYVMEIEDLQQEIEKVYQDSEKEAGKLSEKISTLQEKENNGTITEEEKQELQTYLNSYMGVFEEADTEAGKINSNIKSVKSKAVDTEDKIATAQEWGRKTKEAGENVLNSELLEAAENSTKITKTKDGVTTSWSFTQGAEQGIAQAENLFDKVSEFQKNENIFKK